LRMLQIQEDMAMEPAKEDMLRQRQLTLIGKMLDGYTHRIPGYLATIRESTSRLADLLEQASQRTEEDRVKFANILSTIERQVEMLGRKGLYLRRFAQRMGTALSTFNPGEIVEEAVSLSTRSARVREVSLTAEVAGGLPSLHGDPARTHFVVSILINDMLERVGGGGKIIVRAGSTEKGVLIEVEGYASSEATAVPSPQEGNRYWSIGQQIVADLGGRLEAAAMQVDRRRSSLLLPITLAPKEKVAPSVH
jgi:signal transduction histidine kinase